MDRNEMELKVFECVAVTYKKGTEEITRDTRFKEDLGGQSILMVGLISLIENELDVLVSLPEAAACKTIGELMDKIGALM